METPIVPASKPAAQQRADRIAAFRNELAELDREGVLALTGGQRAAVESHHARILGELSERFDVDVGEREKRLSLGLRIASFLGAVALAISVFLYFRRIWGEMPAWGQIAVLIGAPVLALVATELAARRERTGYFASLFALLACACLVLNVVMLGKIFNLAPSPGAYLAWGAFGLLLGYAYGLRLPLAAGGIAAMVWAAAQISVGNVEWTDALSRSECFLLPGLLLFAVPLFVPHRKYPELAPVHRVIGLSAVLLTLMVLAHNGAGSWLPWDRETVEAFYQVAGLVACAATIAGGLRFAWRDTVYVGSAFFVASLLADFADWWWDWMPSYLFFLIVGLTAVLAMLGLKRLRTVMPAGRPA